MSTRLFVGNLAFSVTENELEDLFTQHGPVVEVNLMMDRMTGRPRGFAFITMGSPEAAQAAISALDGSELQGRPMKVNEARPREERPSFGGGGGGGGFRERREGGGSRESRGGGGGGGGGGSSYGRRRY